MAIPSRQQIAEPFGPVPRVVEGNEIPPSLYSNSYRHVLPRDRCDTPRTFTPRYLVPSSLRPLETLESPRLWGKGRTFFLLVCYCGTYSQNRRRMRDWGENNRSRGAVAHERWLLPIRLLNFVLAHSKRLGILRFSTCLPSTTAECTLHSNTFA